MSLNKGICTLEDDTLTVDYEQLQCAQGSLTEPDITATYNTSTSKITFENTAMEGLAYCNADDKTYGVKCPPVVYINTIIKYLKYYIMKVKDFINGQFQGRHNNLIFYTRGNIRPALCHSRQKTEMGNRGTYPQTAGRSDTLQGSTSFLHDVYQTSVARNLAGRSKNSGTTRPERVFLKKLPLLRRGRPNRRFREFHVHGRHFTSPQESESKRGRSSVQGHMARRTDVENRIRNGQITNRGII